MKSAKMRIAQTQRSGRSHFLVTDQLRRKRVAFNGATTDIATISADRLHCGVLDVLALDHLDDFTTELLVALTALARRLTAKVLGTAEVRVAATRQEDHIGTASTLDARGLGVCLLDLLRAVGISVAHSSTLSYWTNNEGIAYAPKSAIKIILPLMRNK
jgi:hypothetical protein